MNLDTKKQRHYLDHASTTFPKPPAVWEAFLHQAREVGAPAGRSSYGDATETDRQIGETRLALSRFFGARPERVAFTLNATDALNMVLKSHLHPGDHVITTQLEHNSIMRPLSFLEDERDVSITTIPASREGFINPLDIRESLNSKTRLIAMMHASNVTGNLLAIEETSQLAHNNGIAFLVDAAQTAGTLPIHLEKDGIDFLAVPGHKGLLGPPGTGALIFSEKFDISPLREGGTGFQSKEIRQPLDYPQRLESGSPNAPAIVALGAAIHYLNQRGLGAIRDHLEDLMRVFQSGLEKLNGVHWYGTRDISRREPVYAINVNGYAPEELAAILDTSFGVQVRSGLHCAPGTHQAIGTYPEGTCRFSFGAMSTLEDVEAALEALGRVGG